MKDKLKLFMKLARKQMPVLICIVIVLAAVGLSFWPTQSWFQDLQSKLSASLSSNSQLNDLLTKERHLPIVGGSSTATPQVLPYFPTLDVINVGVNAVNQVQTQSKSLLDWATKVNVHVPLDAQLPFTIDQLMQGKISSALTTGKTDDVSRANWVRKYLQAMSNDARIRSWPPPEVNEFRTITIPFLLADQRVTAQEITDAQATLLTDINNQYLVRDSSGNITADSQAQATNTYNDQAPKVPGELEMARSHKCKVYLEPGAIKQPAIFAVFAGAINAPAPADIWTAQLFLWIDEDAASAVAIANAAAKDVTESPVKQIVDVTIKDPPYLISGDPNAGKEDAQLTSVLDATPTGRVSNGMYDVMQFSMTLDVDAAKVPDVIDSLQSQQFVTVISAQVQAIDSTDMLLAGWVYGKSPVVRLTLICEDLFLRSWTSNYQPEGAGASKYAAAGGQGASTPSMLPVVTHQ